MTMEKKERIPTLVFGCFQPYTTDKDIEPLLFSYLRTAHYKDVIKIKEQYLVEKWTCLREIFEPETICKDLRKINEDLRLKHILQQRREYYVKNKEKVLLIRKTCREKNKEKIEHKSGEKVLCECGAEVRRDYMRKYINTKTHLELLKEKEKVPERKTFYYNNPLNF